MHLQLMTFTCNLTISTGTCILCYASWYTKVFSNSVLSTTNEATKKLSQCQHCLPMVPARKDDNVTFLLNNCTFSGCSIMFTGYGVNQMQSSKIHPRKGDT